MKTAIAALILSLLSLIVTLVLGIKNFRKSKRLEFFQRRDQLFAKISELNNKVSQFLLYVGRYEVIAMKNESLSLDPEFEKRRNQIVTAVRAERMKIEASLQQWFDIITELQSLGSCFMPETGTDGIERLIAIAQKGSNTITRMNEGYSAALLILADVAPTLVANMEQIQKQLQEDKSEMRKALAEFKDKEKSSGLKESLGS